MTADPRSTRRAFLRTAGAVVAGGSAAVVLAACAPGSPAGTNRSSTTTKGSTTVPSTSAGAVLLAYYSRPGENFYYGDRRNLTTGNTQVFARMLAAEIDCDVFRIEAADPYPSGYDATVARNVREQQADERPRIAGDLPSLDGYDTVLLGSPIWNVRPPMLMSTFAESYDWAGKRLFPFVTYAVSELGSTASVYREVAAGARIGDGLAVQGETVADAAGQATAWLRRIGLR